MPVEITVNRSLNAQVSIYVLHEIRLRGLFLADICRNYEIPLDLALFSMGYGPPSERLRQSFCDILGFHSWQELQEAALAAGGVKNVFAEKREARICGSHCYCH